MPEPPKSILEQALRLTHDAALDKVAAEQPDGIGVEATKQGAEIDVSGSKGRLSGTAYVASTWSSLKQISAGVKARWRFK